MPWSGKSFAKKHNKRLKGKKASQAAAIANSEMRRGMPEGVAIRIANAKMKKIRTIVSRRRKHGRSH